MMRTTFSALLAILAVSTIAEGVNYDLSNTDNSLASRDYVNSKKSVRGSCGEDLEWSLEDDGTLTISGTGEMENYSSSSSQPWYKSETPVRTVLIKRGVTSLGSNSFSSLTSLVNVTIAETVSFLGRSCFSSCKSLTSIIIPNEVISIGPYAFDGCSSLRDLVILDGVLSIGNHSFSGCSSLTSVSIPQSVTSIGEAVFDSCKSLSSIDVSEENMHFASIDGVLFNHDYTSIIQYPIGKADISYSIPDGVTSIGDYCFNGAKNLTDVTLPPSVRTIGNLSFYYCTKLANVTIPSGVTSLRKYAFGFCSSLTSVTIPPMASVGPYAFYSCSSLTDVNILDGVTSIEEYAFCSCKKLMHITIPDTVESIGGSAFHSCSKLDNVTFSKSLKTIYSYSFYNCESLTSVILPDGVLSIGYNSFAGCRSMAVLTIPDTLQSIGNNAFDCCHSLVSVTIPASVMSIGPYAFASCELLSSVFYDGPITNFSSVAFGSGKVLQNMCVSPAYNSSQFCGIEITNTTTCETYQSMFSNCYKAAYIDGNVTQEKWRNATEWEEQSNECINYQCDNDYGLVAWSVCNSTVNDERVCFEGKCFVNKNPKNDTWSVEIELDDEMIKVLKDVNTSDIVSTLNELTGLDIEQMTVGTKVKNGGVFLVVYTRDEKSANTIASSVNSIIEEGTQCKYGTLCHAKTVRVFCMDEMTELDSASHVLYNHLLKLLMVMMAILWWL